MWTVSKLARRAGLSRTALLYYESIGLMRAPERSSGNYRCYGERDLQRLLEIRAYRDAGLGLADIRAILESPGRRCCKRAATAAHGIGQRDQDSPRTSGGDSETAEPRKSKERKNDYEAEMGFHHEGLRAQR